MILYITINLFKRLITYVSLIINVRYLVFCWFANDFTRIFQNFERFISFWNVHVATTNEILILLFCNDKNFWKRCKIRRFFHEYFRFFFALNLNVKILYLMIFFCFHDNQYKSNIVIIFEFIVFNEMKIS